MKAIFKKEFQSFFHNVTGFIFIAAFLFFYGLYFFSYNLSAAYPYISYSLSSVMFLFIVIVPVISMRIMSEDKKLKTDQLLYTAPVPIWKVVMGKYLAMVAVFSIDMAIVCICPIILSMYGTVPFIESYVGIFGTWLFGVLCLSIGLFISSLTESIVISAIGTFALLFLAYMMDSICSMISSDGNWLTMILGTLSVTTRLNNFMVGTLSIVNVFYYVSGAALFIFLTCQLVQRSRWKTAVKKIRRGVFSTGLIVVVIAAIVAANFGISKIPEKYTEADLSYDSLYTMSDDAKEYLETLDTDITVYVLVAESDADEKLNTTLSQFMEENSHITVEYIDPEESPLFYETYTDEEPTDNSLIVVNGDVSKVIDFDDIYEYTVDYYTYTSTTTGYDGEGQLISAINYVVSDDMPTVYVLTGHSETDLGDSFIDAIEKMNIAIEEVNLLQVDSIDAEEVAGVIINGPNSDFSEDDAEKLSDYLAAGGTVILTTSYAAEETPNLDAVLAEYNIQVEEGVVIEGDTTYYTQSVFYLLPEIESDSLTSDLDSYVILPDSRAITNLDPEEEETDEEEEEDEDDSEEDEEEESTISWTDLFITSESSYLKSDIANITTSEKEDGDEDGPFTVGAYVEDDETGAAIYVFGSTYLFDDTADSMVSGTNLAFFQNMIEDFQDEDSTAVSIPVKEYTLESLTVDQQSAITIGTVMMIGLPIVLIVVGVVIWFRRRRK